MLRAAELIATIGAAMALCVCLSVATILLARTLTRQTRRGRFTRTERARDAKLQAEAITALRAEVKDARHTDEYADSIYRSLRERANAWPSWEWPE